MVEGLGPKLRFAEFAGQPFQCRAPISTLARVQKGQQLPTELKQGNAGYPHFNGGQSPSGFALEANQPANTIIVSEGGNSCGYVQFIREPFWAGGHCYALQPRGDVDAQFLFQALKRKEHDIMRLRVGSGLPNIQKSDIEAFLIEMPQTAAEQRKIAECLTSLDELIAAEGRKLEALRAFKKGLMQNLFPREGETTPRLRFPEFRTSGEWEETSIARTADVITGSTPSTARREYYGGAYQFVSPADITEERYVEQTKTTLSEEGFAVTRFVPAGSVLFVCIGSTIGKVAQNKEHCATNQQINAVVPGPDSFGDFLYYGLAQLSGAVAALAGRQAVPIVSKSLFSSIKIRCPGLPEQRRIASCLVSLDTLITEQTKKLATLKTHKQGLMQGLFPSPESKDACPEMEPL